jgi:hypothetical protein
MVSEILFSLAALQTPIAGLFLPFLGSKGKYFIIEIAPYGRFIVNPNPCGYIN